MWLTLSLFLAALGGLPAQVIQSPDSSDRSIVEGLKCNFDFGVCGLDQTYSGDSWFRFRLVESGVEGEPTGDHPTGFGRFLTFTLPKEHIENHYKFSDLTLATLTKGHTYCFSFWYYLSGKNPGHLIALEEPLEELAVYEGQSHEWKEGKLNLEGHDKALRMRFIFKSGAFGDIGLDDIELTVGKCL
ncbi:enteropeptidase-like [Lineus longissimus]|uniref:enteropeptidase-like n=1 Tax=Lineus longissimus TaxID=88925 RepID=UPI002B4DC5FC